MSNFWAAGVSGRICFGEGVQGGTHPKLCLEYRHELAELLFFQKHGTPTLFTLAHCMARSLHALDER